MVKPVNTRKASSTVISSMILTTVVLVIGGAIWFYSNNASTIVADQYVDGIIDIMDEISERFTVEHVGYDGVVDLLRVWVYNYGEVDAEVDIYAVSGLASDSSFDNEIMSGELLDISFSLGEISGEIVTIKIMSRRGNYAHYQYLAP